MSTAATDGPADGGIEARLSDFVHLVSECSSQFTEAQMQQALVAVVKLYVRKVEESDVKVDPFSGDDLTPTETVTLTAGLLRASGLNMFDLSMWLART